jgi:hypothetical protein
MHNRAFWRALHSLTHPITISAIVLFIINDHYLKQNYPSWWTGKLSDFAGLVFAPLIFAALLAWIIPPHVRHQEKLVGIIAFIFTGLIFALTKTLPQANHATTEFWEFFAGGPVKMWLDPSDLLALPALLIGWFIWQGSSNHAMHVALPALTLIAIGSLAATATSCAEVEMDFFNGVFCVSYFQNPSQDADSKYVITINNGTFLSNDNGTSWQRRYYDRFGQLQPHSLPSRPCIYRNPYWWPYAHTHDYKRPTWQLPNPTKPNEIYRFEPTKSIQLSEDGGQTWITAYDLTWVVSEERMIGLNREQYHDETGDLIDIGPCSNYDPPKMPTGPYDAAFLPETGQLFIAMGLDGLLVRQPSGEWEWVSVGQYRLEGVAEIDLELVDLWPQFLMALAAAGLTFLFISQPLARPCMAVGLATIAWIIWAIVLTAIHLTPSAPPYFEIDSVSAFWMIGIFSPILVGYIVYSISHIQTIPISKRKIAPALILITIFAFLACFTPFLRWARYENFDAYSTATSEAIWQVLIVQVAGLLFMLFWYRKHKVDVTVASPPSADHPK